MGTEVKFKVGDTVRVIDGNGGRLPRGSEHTVHHVSNMFIFLKENDEVNGWFPDRFELVVEPRVDLGAISNTPAPLTGGSSAYYKLPLKAVDLQDLIEHKDMSFAMANIFKASYRFGDKPGVSQKYDLEKIIYFANRELALLSD